MKNKLQRAGVGLAILAVTFAPVLPVVMQAHAADDYIINATDTVPIFTQAATVGKSNFVAISNVALPYYVGFMIALVILVLALLPVKKIWGVIAGHFS